MSVDRNKPLVSIITITFNRADLIHRCIESIQKQTYDNYEHIIVDGNSTDDTEAVVKSYNDSHIKYIKLTTRGPQLQMRAGANVAKGKYVTFLDDDDEYLATKIEKQVSLFETEPPSVGVVYCWMTYFSNDNPDKPLYMHKTELRGFVGDVAPTYPAISGTPTMMLRREVFEEFGGTYDDNIGYVGSDWELMARICQKYEVDYVPNSLVKVYINHGYARLSTDFYQDKAKKGVVFHTHFLKTFENVFNRNPKSAKFHYYNLARCYATLKDRKHAWFYYKKYLASAPKLTETIKALGGIILGR